MDIDKLPDECPECGHTIFKQKVTIEGFAIKQYYMKMLSADITHPPLAVSENTIADNDYYNDIVCSACGAMIVEADVTRSSKKG